MINLLEETKNILKKHNKTLEDIEWIVTKEQFESIQCEVE